MEPPLLPVLVAIVGAVIWLQLAVFVRQLPVSLFWKIATGVVAFVIAAYSFAQAVEYFVDKARGDTVTQKSARLETRGIKVVPVGLNKPDPWPAIIVDFLNAGDGPLIGLARLERMVFTPGPPPKKEAVEASQDAMLNEFDWKDRVKANEGRQLYPNVPMNFLVPDRFDDSAKVFRDRYSDIVSGRATLLVLLTWKYKDEASGDRLRVTETCFYVSGSLAIHANCGRSRTFLEE